MTQFVAARLLASLTVGVSAGRQKARVVLLILAIAFLIIALARPQMGFRWEEARSRGLDIVVAIDTSRSMLATDVAPNRLQRAKLEALNLKRLARADRLGLVAFAGSAFLQSPLTLDDEAFRQSVEMLDVNIIPQGGTALGEAIAAAKSAFKEGNDNHKVLVLFTDGEDHDGHAVEAAKQAAKDGLNIFTIGVGTPGGEMLRTTDVQGRTEFIKDAEGNAVKSRLDETVLRDMAREAGGFYLPMSGASTMNLLYERGLAPLPKSDRAAQKVKRPYERYQWLLGAALMLLLVEMLVPERKRIAAPLVATPATSRARTVAALLALLLWPGLAAASPGRGLQQYRSGKFDASQLEYERALEKRPADSRLHFNAGTAAFQARDYDQALSHLNSALVTPDLKLQQQAYYNIGNTQFRLGDDVQEPDKKKKAWEQAVKGYESALKLDAQDKDAEFNLEFVKQRLEELKQQQQQDKDKDKDQDKDKEKDKDKDKEKESKKDKEQKDSESKDQEKKEQQKQDQEKKDQEKQPDQKKPDDKQDSQSANQDKKEGEKKDGQQAAESKDKPEDAKDPDAAPQGMASIRMTPQQAMQLLDTLKSEEKSMPFRPLARTNRPDRVFKDW